MVSLAFGYVRHLRAAVAQIFGPQGPRGGDARGAGAREDQRPRARSHRRRTEVFEVVKNLAHRGSRAWPVEAGYRGADAPTPEALIAVFRDALGIHSAEE
jgi:hypothetical protein